ncbi:hypothetical protein B0T16DRAFT_422817 [Cercophora newfieldiana]|uniref:Uncharacterized protein n=1 Tax=Cercophora newfieldiana TaxID=92897 RepID=A0AA39XTB3_9PEZI|nr:hypothetical protein B0T16DRAFT_422817 [Cercophora newfieldiana]
MPSCHQIACLMSLDRGRYRHLCLYIESPRWDPDTDGTKPPYPAAAPCCRIAKRTEPNRSLIDSMAGDVPQPVQPHEAVPGPKGLDATDSLYPSRRTHNRRPEAFESQSWKQTQRGCWCPNWIAAR